MELWTSHPLLILLLLLLFCSCDRLTGSKFFSCFIVIEQSNGHVQVNIYVCCLARRVHFILPQMS